MNEKNEKYNSYENQSNSFILRTFGQYSENIVTHPLYLKESIPAHCNGCTYCCNAIPSVYVTIMMFL